MNEPSHANEIAGKLPNIVFNEDENGAIHCDLSGIAQNIITCDKETKMSDLISRQAAIDLFLEKGMVTAAIYVERMPSAQRWKEANMNNETELALLQLEHRYGKEVRDRVEHMGFVIPKKGHWNEDWLASTSGGAYQVWRCSECKSAFNWRMKYCGHCGARMDEVER